MSSSRAAATGLTILALLVVAAPTGAQESPDALTRPESRCQLTTARRLLRYSDDASRCYGQCQADLAAGLPRSCGSFGADAATQHCLDRARGGVERPVRRSCRGAACPECYFGARCESFTDEWLGNVAILAASNAAVLHCDDGGSADGLSPGERDCRDRVAAAGLVLSRDLRQCLLRCQKRLRRGAVTDASCHAADVDGPDFDASAQDCVERARAFFAATCGECADVPECWAQGLPFGCLAAGQMFEFSSFTLSGEFFCVDRPVCGDGIVSATEACDPNATPDGCAAGTVCDASCTCQLRPDRCAAPTIIASLGGAVGGTRTGPDVMQASCGGSGPEQVFRWTPQESGTATVRTCLGASVTQVSVREAVCDEPAAEIACAANACAGGAGLSFPVVAGTTYYLVVDGVGEGTFLLSVTPPPSDPPLCSTAEAVVTLDFVRPPPDGVMIAHAVLSFPGPKLAHVPPATNLASPEGAFLTWVLDDVDPLDGFDDELDVSLLDLFGSVPPGDFVAADFTCRPGADLPTASELSCTARISTEPLSGVFTPVPCAVTSFTVTPPPGP